MKTIFAFGALAAICKSAYSFKGGLYSISVDYPEDLYLTVQSPPNPLNFTALARNQKWSFSKVGDSETYWILYFDTTVGEFNFINCPSGQDLCHLSASQQAFTIHDFSPRDRQYYIQDETGRTLVKTDKDQLNATLETGYHDDPIFYIK
ncbi:uncharacterized protein N7484_004969 [Penicillium longicatenatum]|uniref:uncharacterized protein n=1 Tax=Penicillium longicatenatum TaxID=1561947 RepID=UPI002548B167|nr:uncharacterized protein N7484_004969 [Penicillium longicatenatum]KAJ5651246.1 hypothetical protein N7484_004969 [Penicillium longicatenatum]